MSELALAVLRQFLLFSAILFPLELLLPARRQGLARPGSGTDLLYFVIGPFLIKGGTLVLFALLAAALERLVPAGPRAALRAQPGAVQFAEIVLVAEIGSYWVHRLSHRVPWLWRFHAVHHSNQALDWLASHRQHPVEAVALLGVANLPVLLLGFSMEPLLGFVLFQKLYTALLHANVRLGYGRLTAVLASPQFHHWHHDAEAGAAAGNYASTLPGLDLLFGTYRLPEGFPSRYGIDEPMPEGYAAQLLHPFRR